MLTPSTVKPPETSANDPRLGHFIQQASTGTPRVVLLGFKSDEGVRRNGGRLGAAAGPDAIRQALYKLTPDPLLYAQFSRLLEQTRDLGDLAITGDLEQDQENLGLLTASWLAKGVIPVLIGGGHETAYGHFLGYAHNKTAVNILNVDAHADVRPLKEGLAHSGSPFFQALGHPGGWCNHYTLMGLAPWSVSRAHLDYLNEQGCDYHWIDEVTPAVAAAYFSQIKSPAMVTMDMDAVEQCSAPGVSAPAPRGLSLEVFHHVAHQAGLSPLVHSLDLVEVNPLWDIDQRTARAAAVTIWHFLRGIAMRNG